MRANCDDRTKWFQWQSIQELPSLHLSQAQTIPVNVPAWFLSVSPNEFHLSCGLLSDAVATKVG
jgi:hypothetical protein